MAAVRAEVYDSDADGISCRNNVLRVQRLLSPPCPFPPTSNPPHLPFPLRLAQIRCLLSYLVLSTHSAGETGALPWCPEQPVLGVTYSACEFAEGGQELDLSPVDLFPPSKLFTA